MPVSPLIWPSVAVLQPGRLMTRPVGFRLNVANTPGLCQWTIGLKPVRDSRDPVWLSGPVLWLSLVTLFVLVVALLLF
jgi:hypothetical protein